MCVLIRTYIYVCTPNLYIIICMFLTAAYVVYCIRAAETLTTPRGNLNRGAANNNNIIIIKLCVYTRLTGTEAFVLTDRCYRRGR